MNQACCSASRFRHISLTCLLLALFGLTLADISVIQHQPWTELARIGWGLLTPDPFAIDELLHALLNTLAFALLGVALAVPCGAVLALLFDWAAIRSLCALLRAVHELFWALLLMQLFGLSTLTGLLAIAIPYSAIFAKVYAEILEESPPEPGRQLAPGCDSISRFFYARLPQAYSALRDYTRYRLECGLRSSAVLGFIGLPTLGFHLETSFSQGLYSQAAAVLYLFVAIILLLPKLLQRRRWLPLYLILAIYWLPWQHNFDWGLILQFVSHDLLPAPLHQHSLSERDGWLALSNWSWSLLWEQGLPGAWQSLLLSFIAMVLAGALALLLFPLISRQFMSRPVRASGHLLLVVIRSIPELILAFVFVLICGPSMLPAILALALHNGAIVAHLIGLYSHTLILPIDAVRGGNRYLYEVLPRLYLQFLAFLFYRWEVILRESAILGILGIHTLGFYIDSAFELLHFDRAGVLILLTALLNIAVDRISREMRLRLHLPNSPNCYRLPPHER